MTSVIQLGLVGCLIGAALHDGRFGLALGGYALLIIGGLRVLGDPMLFKAPPAVE